MTNASLYRCPQCNTVYAFADGDFEKPQKCARLARAEPNHTYWCGGQLEPFTPVPASQEAPSA